MKTTKLFFMAALALMTAACSNSDNDILTPAEQPAKAGGITITAKLAPKSSAGTRALEPGKDGDNKDIIKATWAVNEHLAILYEKDGKQMADATITAVDGTTGVATITFTVVEGTANNTDCQIIYPYSAAKGDKTGVKDNSTLLGAQNGTLNANLDVRVGAGTIQTSNPSLTVTTQPEAQFAIFKFTIQDLGGTAVNADEFVVSDNDGNVITTVTPSSAASELYVVMPVLSAGSTYWFKTTSISGYYYKHYIAKKTIGASATEAGKYYQSTVKMATFGDVILADGTFAVKGTAGERAIIAYVGEDAQPGYKHGLALALEAANSGNKVAWCNRSDETCLSNQYSDQGDAYAHDVDGIANTAALVGHGSHTHAAAIAANSFTGERPANTSQWFLPTVGQWNRIYADADGKDNLISKTGMKSDGCWSSTEVDYEYAWDSYLDWEHFKDDELYVRACLAF